MVKSGLQICGSADVDIDKLELNFIFRLRTSVRVRVGVRVRFSISIYLIDVIKLRIGSVWLDCRIVVLNTIHWDHDCTNCAFWDV